MQLEQKLALIQQMRQDENWNNRRMGARTEGSYSYRERDLSGADWAEGQVFEEQGSLFSSSFRLRFLLAIFLFLFFFYMDVSSVSVGNIDSQFIQTYVSKNLAPSSLLTLIDDIH